MSGQVPASFQVKFQNNVEATLNQVKSELIDAVEVTDETGASKMKVKDLVGNAKGQETDERHGKTKYADTPHDGVWLPKKNGIYYAELVDSSDQLETSIGLESSYVMEGASVIERAKDQRILEGIYGDIISGREGTVTTPFPAGQIVPVTTGGASGAQRFNVAKVRAANKMLSKAHVNKAEKKYMAITAEQSDDLLSEVPATSSDFVRAFGGEVDENGFLRRLLGFNFLHIELDNEFLGTIPALSLDGSGYRKNPFWVKSGVRVNFWERMFTRVGELPERNYSEGVYARTTLAATRTQAGKVGIILNSEA